MRGEFALRLLGMVVFGLLGWQLGAFVAGLVSVGRGIVWIIPLTVLGVGLGFAFSPHITVRPLRWAGRRIKQAPAHTFIAVMVGLIIGLIISALLAIPLSMLPGWWGRVFPLLVAVLVSYLSVSVMVMRGRELFHFFGFKTGAGKATPEKEQIILDTSAIIDGRIADISQTGFIQGILLIPGFILDELRHIADSSDPLRRNRGRRGLEMLSKLQKESDAPIQILDVDIENGHEVDTKLVQLAKELRCSIITNDYNLNRVAELQGVRALNINELASAVKPLVLPGEELTLRIVQEGKEAGQGVGFLDDGTMVVVEGGQRHLNSDLEIVVTKVLQTSAGRMVFANPQNGVRSGRVRK